MSSTLYKIYFEKLMQNNLMLYTNQVTKYIPTHFSNLGIYISLLLNHKIKGSNEFSWGLGIVTINPSFG